MSRFEQLAPTDTKMRRENMNSIIDWVDKLSNLRVGEGLVLSDGPAGLCLALDGALPRVAILKMTNSAGSYPTYENDRYIFPARIAASPAFDYTDVDLAHVDAFLETPSVNVYNLAKCWLFEDDYLLAVQLGGMWWTYNRRPMRAQSSAGITKGNLGSCATINSPTITISDCRAVFADTASGKKVWIEHDGVEWVIQAEECP
jgi:hypothetical protein